MAAFRVKGPAGSVSLDLQRRGRCTVEVENLLPRAVPVKLQFDRLSPAKPWLSIVGEPVAEIGVSQSHQFQVAITVPVDAGPGDYSIVPEAVSLRNPDEEFATGAPITFAVKAPPGAPPPSGGYLTTLIGAVAAALVAALLGTIPAILWLISVSHVPPGVNESLGDAIGRVFAQAIFAAILLVLGLLAGLWVGPPIGALIALRLRSYPGAGWTAAALAVLQPVWLVGLVILLNILAKLNLKVSGALNILLLIALYLLATAVPPWPARGLVLLLLRRRR